MQEQRHLVEQPLGRLGPLDDDGLGIPAQLLLVIGRQVAAGIDDDRREGISVLAAQRLQQGVARSVGQRQIEHHAIEGLLLEQLQTIGGGSRADGFDIVGGEQPGDRLALNVIVLDDQNPVHALRQLGLELLQNVGQFVALDRLEHVAHGAERESGLRVIRPGNHVNRDVLGLHVALQAIEDRETRLVRQADIENDRARHMLLGERQRLLGGARHQGLEPHLARQVAQDAGEGLVILDHQQDAFADRQPVAVVIDFTERRRRRRGGANRLLTGGSGGKAGPGLARRHRGGVVGRGNDEREGAALAFAAGQMDRSAQ